MVTSQNGWSANQRSQTQAYTIGNGRKIQLRKGDAGFVLKHFADWFDQKIEDIDQGADDWGYAERKVRGSDTEVSNHASGTAIDLNATKHSLGKRGTFSAAKTSAIRQRLKLYDGVIRWGGDYRRRADEMHFEINADSAAVSAVAAKLRAGQSDSNLKRIVDPIRSRVPIEVTRIRNAINNRRPLPLADLETLIRRGTKPYAAAAKALRDAMQPAMRAWLDATSPKPVKKAAAKKTTTAKKAPAKKTTTAKKAPAKKAPAKKAPAKKTPAKKTS